LTALALDGAHESAYLRRVNYQLSMETCTSNLKSVALTVLELLPLNAQKFRGSHDPGHAPFQKNFKGHVRTVPGNMNIKFDVCSFNRLKLV